MRVRPGLLLAIILVAAILVWQYRFRDFSVFTGPELTQQKVDFKHYALRNYAISKLEYHGGNEIWVRLGKTDAMAPVDLERIVNEIALDYKTRVGDDEEITVYLLHPVHQDVLARTTK